MQLRNLRDELSALFEAGKAGSFWHNAPFTAAASFFPWSAIRFAPAARPEAAEAAPAVSSQTIVESATVPSDPLFDNQWHLLNEGQTGGQAGIDVNVVEIWDDYTGAGVLIGVIDTGLEYTHPDLVGGVNTAIDYDALQNDNDPFAGTGENHATAVSGMIVAQPNNGIGVSGVAYGADVASFRMGFGSNTLPQIEANLARQVNVDISSNSWAYNGYFFDNFDQAAFAGAEAALQNAVMNGRDGLGTVFFFAAGNSRTSGQDTNLHSFQSSPWTIAVASVNEDGVYSSFSTPGASLLVSAPGEDVLTTDRVGGNGYVGGDYVTISGTSFATPLAAGVAALMLEANPDLGYRDVQEILAYSARQIDPGRSSWLTNGADNWNGGGLHTSRDYGFGLIDAHAAVRLAETWTASSTYANQLQVSASASPNSLIPDPGTLNSSVTINTPVQIDQVTVTLNIDHTWIGDLVIRLTSPDGTQSILLTRPGKNPDGGGYGTSQDDIQATLSSTQFWGENGQGTWTLSVQDAAGAYSGRLISWSLTLIGDAVVDDDTYVFTDEFAAFAGAEYLLQDSAGHDALNASAVTSDSDIDLDENAVSDIAGQALRIANGSQIEAAYGGDGNDRIEGNELANSLFGMRGDDTLYGDGGNDMLTGGEGDDSLFGGSGTDTAFFSGNLAGYSVVAGGGGTVTVTDLVAANGDDGQDLLSGIEFLQFADQLIAAPGGAPSNPPTDMALAGSSIGESAANGALVGTVSTTDADLPGETFTYSLTNSAGGRFSIDANDGKVRVANGGLLDFESATSHTITVKVTDSDSNTYTEAFTIGLTDDTSEFQVGAISDSNAAANAVSESAANGAAVGITAAASDADASDSVNFTLANSAGGRFAINGTSGQVTVANGAALDAETAASHQITVKATSTDGSTSTQSFTIAIGDDDSEFQVSAVSDGNAAANAVSESAANGTAVGITAMASDGDVSDGVSYSLADSAGGRFAINGSSGVVTVANGALLDAESATGHAITVKATSTDGSTSTETFTITVSDDDSEFQVSAIADTNGADEEVSESAANGTAVGITALASDADLSDSVSYSLDDDAGGRFTIDGTSGVVTVANGALLDAESATGHQITVKALSTDGSTSTETFSIAIADDDGEFQVSAISDSNGAGNGVAESAANGTAVGITAAASDADVSDSVSYSLDDDAGGRFAIDGISGVVTVANGGLLDYETDTSHQITVKATSTDGSTSTQSFTVAISDDSNEFLVGPVSDSDGAANSVSESAANGTAVGITAFAEDLDAPDTVSYSLSADAGGRFTIDGTSGEVTVLDGALLDFESATSHQITVKAISSDGSTSTQSFTIGLTDDTGEAQVGAISDSNGAANTVSESAANGTAVGVTAAASDADASDGVSFSLDDSAGGRFAIDGNSGVVTVANGALLDFESATSHQITVKAASTDGSTSTESFTIALTDDVLEDDVSLPVDSNGAANSLAEDAGNGDTVGITALAADGDASDSVTYSLSNNAGGRFAINASSGVVTVAAAALLNFEAAASHEITVKATSTDGSTSTESFTIAVTDVNEAPVLEGALTAQEATEDAPFSYLLPAGLFSDEDASHGDSLTLTASLEDDSPLPAWLSFDGSEFTGLPDSGDLGDITVKVTATDEGGLTESTTFALSVGAAASGPIVIDGDGTAETIDVSGSDIAHVIHGMGAGDTIIGSSAGDTLFGDAGGDTIMGGPGDDLIYGGLGDDKLTGGAGRDTFVWQSGEGGSGGKNAGIEVRETITDFTVDLGNPANADVLDLGDLLTTSAPDDTFMRFTVSNVSGGAQDDTVLRVDYNGHQATIDTLYKPTLEITFEDVDLYAAYGVTEGDHQALIDAMQAANQLVV